jgi:hypothetical protein
MPMDLIGWIVMRPPILQLGLDFIILWVPPSLAEKPFIAFSGMPGRSIVRFCSFGFYLLPATFTLWAFTPFFPQGKVQPFASLENPMLEPMQGMDERENDEK